MLHRILSDRRRIQYTTQYILRAWAACVGAVILVLFLILKWLFTIFAPAGFALLILMVGSAYFSLFASMGYSSKLHQEHEAIREAEREAERAAREKQSEETDRKWNEARAEKERLAELERAETQRRIKELESGEQAG